MSTPSSITKKTHPPDDGWLHTSITLKSTERLPTEQAECFVCGFGDPAKWEIALCSQNGKRLKGVARKLDHQSTKAA